MGMNPVGYEVSTEGQEIFLVIDRGMSLYVPDLTASVFPSMFTFFQAVNLYGHQMEPFIVLDSTNFLI